MYKRYVKRLLDILLSVSTLIFLSPLLLVTAALVYIKLGSPVVFRQPRPGLNEKIFYLYKFRTMTNEVDESGRLLPDSQRLTKFGSFLRTSSLDELLELINIIKGDMSVVGPRPLSIYYLPHYPNNLRKRHMVRPGLTGLAQINGRNNLPWDDRFKLDIQYVDELSFFLDLRIVLSTILKVMKRSDVVTRGTAKVMDYGPHSILKEEGLVVSNKDEMSYSEIGSYFWLDECKYKKGSINWLPNVSDACYSFSGRSAIEIALRDILREHTIHNVYVPSYCCVSMLQPFIDHRIKIRFFQVTFVGGRFKYEIPQAGKHDIVLIMSYFGLDSTATHEAIGLVHDRGSIVIQDITHSMLRKEAASQDSDYLVASLRKWFAIPTGGWVGKRRGSISEKPTISSNHAVAEKIRGMHEKYRYLTGKTMKKEDFLLAQAKFENDLIHVDRMLRIDDLSFAILESADINVIIQQRRANAKVLIEGLAELGICVLPEFDFNADTPLFIPIFLESAQRDSLRNHLISNGIYCPIHWPETMGAPVGIRENELSLICDQRYSNNDMHAILECIKSWSK